MSEKRNLEGQRFSRSHLFSKSWVQALLAVATLFTLASIHIGLTPIKLLESLEGVSSVFEMMFPPDFKNFPSILNSIAVTLSMALFGTVGAALIAVPTAFLMNSNTRLGKISSNLLTVFASISRSIPDVVFALVLVALLGIGPLSGAIAIIIGTSGALARLLSNSIDLNDHSARNALINIGVSRTSASISATLREVLPSFISVIIYRFEINVKTSTVLGVVGAGGIGTSLRNGLETFDFQRVSALTISLIATIAALELISTVSRYALIGGGNSMISKKGFGVKKTRKLCTQGRVFLIALAATLTFGLFSSINLVISGFEFRNRPSGIFIQVLGQLLKPDFFNATSNLFFLMFQTVEIGLLATIIGAAAGLPFAFLAAWNVSPAKPLFFASRTVMAFIRGMPNIVFALIFVSGIGLGPVAGVFALSITSMGICFKLTADALEMASPGPRVALMATGASRVQEFFSAVFPQVKSQIVSNVLFAFDLSVRQATLLGLVGAGGIGYSLVEAVHLFQFETVSAIVLLIISTVLIIEYTTKAIKNRLEE